MKTPRIDDFDPNAKIQPLKSPLDGMPTIGKPQPKNNAASLPSVPETKGTQEHGASEEKPAKPQNRKPANLPASTPALEKPEKYTTRLEPSIIKQVRLAAIEKDMKDYEVVRTALLEYFAKQQ